MSTSMVHVYVLMSSVHVHLHVLAASLLPLPSVKSELVGYELSHVSFIRATASIQVDISI